MFSKSRQELAGFTLIEILVVVALIGILAAVVIANMSDTTAAGRDAQRQADLRAMQNAIELYKQRWGRYPEGCNGTNWSGQPDTAFECVSGGGPVSSRYIVGSTAPVNRPFSEFMPKLPIDEKLPPEFNGPEMQRRAGYAYITNAEGSVYKLMAMYTVESELVDYYHPFKSCEVRPNTLGVLPNISNQNTAPDLAGWCGRAFQNVTSDLGIPDPVPATGGFLNINRCRISTDHQSASLHTDTHFPDSLRRFDRSYGVWGGFAPDPNSFSNYAQRIRNTTAVICK